LTLRNDYFIGGQASFQLAIHCLSFWWAVRMHPAGASERFYCSISATGSFAGISAHEQHNYSEWTLLHRYGMAGFSLGTAANGTAVQCLVFALNSSDSRLVAYCSLLHAGYLMAADTSHCRHGDGAPIYPLK